MSLGAGRGIGAIGSQTQEDGHMDSTRLEAINNTFPPEIKSLPQVEIPVDGVTGYCLQNQDKQVVFFRFDEGVSFPDHSHCEQRGMIIEGEMIIEIDGQSNLYQTGDTYRVPGGVKHRASFTRPTTLVDMSEAPDRYRVHG